MRQFLLALALVATPIGAFALGYRYLSPAPIAAPAANLGDLSQLKSIITDVQAISNRGDLKKAADRITDFETAWDEEQPVMRPLNPVAWGNVEEAADAARSSLRAANPAPAPGSSTLAGLLSKLEAPGDQAAAAASKDIVVDGVTISGPDGRPRPCEDMIKQLDQAIASAKLADATAAKVADFKTKALERCNADDDLRADEFSARGIALAAH